MDNITIEEKYRRAYINILPTPFKTKNIKLDYNDFEDIYTKNIAIDVVSKVKNSNDYVDCIPDCVLINVDYNKLIIESDDDDFIKCLATIPTLLIKDSNKVIIRYGENFYDIDNKELFNKVIKQCIKNKILYPTNKSDIFVVNHNMLYCGGIELFHIAYHDLYIKKPDGILNLIDNKVHLYDNLNYYE